MPSASGLLGFRTRLASSLSGDSETLMHPGFNRPILFDRQQHSQHIGRRHRQAAHVVHRGGPVSRPVTSWLSVRILLPGVRTPMMMPVARLLAASLFVEAPGTLATMGAGARIYDSEPPPCADSAEQRNRSVLHLRQPGACLAAKTPTGSILGGPLSPLGCRRACACCHRGCACAAG